MDREVTPIDAAAGLIVALKMRLLGQDARISKLEPIVNLAATWYLAGNTGAGAVQAQIDLGYALHAYLELT